MYLRKIRPRTTYLYSAASCGHGPQPKAFPSFASPPPLYSVPGGGRSSKRISDRLKVGSFGGVHGRDRLDQAEEFSGIGSPDPSLQVTPGVAAEG
jgi:hypothetical protein